MLIIQHELLQVLLLFLFNKRRESRGKSFIDIGILPLCNVIYHADSLYCALQPFLIKHQHQDKGKQGFFLFSSSHRVNERKKHTSNWRIHLFFHSFYLLKGNKHIYYAHILISIMNELKRVCDDEVNCT